MLISERLRTASLLAQTLEVNFYWVRSQSSGNGLINIHQPWLLEDSTQISQFLEVSLTIPVHSDLRADSIC